MAEDTKLLTTQEAAKELGISDNHLRTLISTSQAHPKRQIGGTWMFTLDEVERIRHRPKKKSGRPKKAVQS